MKAVPRRLPARLYRLRHRIGGMVYERYADSKEEAAEKCGYPLEDLEVLLDQPRPRAPGERG